MKVVGVLERESEAGVESEAVVTEAKAVDGGPFVEVESEVGVGAGADVEDGRVESGGVMVASEAVGRRTGVESGCGSVSRDDSRSSVVMAAQSVEVADGGSCVSEGSQHSCEGGVSRVLSRVASRVASEYEKAITSSLDITGTSFSKPNARSIRSSSFFAGSTPFSSEVGSPFSSEVGSPFSCAGGSSSGSVMSVGISDALRRSEGEDLIPSQTAESRYF